MPFALPLLWGNIATILMLVGINIFVKNIKNNVYNGAVAFCNGVVFVLFHHDGAYNKTRAKKSKKGDFVCTKKLNMQKC